VEGRHYRGTHLRFLCTRIYLPLATIINMNFESLIPYITYIIAHRAMALLFRRIWPRSYGIGTNAFAFSQVHYRTGKKLITINIITINKLFLMNFYNR